LAECLIITAWPQNTKWIIMYKRHLWKNYFGQTRIYKLQIHHSRWESDRPWKCNRRKLYQKMSTLH
jgi:hypothetical protein